MLFKKFQPEWLLRISLGIVYLWFGALKLLGVSPVFELVRLSYPPLATLPLYLGLTLFELALGVLLLAGLWRRWVAAAVVFHLMGTFGVLIFSPHAAFYPWFPFLTMDGEFVIKNLVLMAAAVSLFLIEDHSVPSTTSKPNRWVLVSFLLLGGVAVGWGFPYLDQSLRAASGTKSVSSRHTEVRATAAMVNTLAAGTHFGEMVMDGTVVSHCRLLGCWLILRDPTGKVFVNVAPGTLDVRRLADGDRVQVRGHIGTTCEGTTGFIASSVKPEDVPR